MSSVVFFGKAHAGKSTLAGTLYAQSKSIDIDRQARRFETDLPNFDPSSVYAMLFDDTKQERHKLKGSTTGSTITRHYRNVSLPDGRQITVIDTPGAEHLSKERHRGMFAGDVGVFCLEVSDVVNDSFFVKDEQYRVILTTLALWAGLARNRVIVALTKMDECDFSEKEYYKARDVILDLCEGVSLSAEFVPTSVEVKDRLTHNIFGRSERLAWYSGPSLTEMLATHLQETESDRIYGDGLLFSVDQEFDQSRSRSGKIWRIKVISGTVRKGETISLGPVVDEKRNFFMVRGTVKSIHSDLHRSEERNEIEEAGPGTIAGLDLKALTSEKGRTLGKDDFHAIYTTCGFSSEADYAASKRLVFGVDAKHEDVFTPRREFGLAWFGRIIPFSVVSSSIEDDGDLSVECELKARPIAMPRNVDGSFLRDALLIRTETARNRGDYIPGKLLKIT